MGERPVAELLGTIRMAIGEQLEEVGQATSEQTPMGAHLDEQLDVRNLKQVDEQLNERLEEQHRDEQLDTHGIKEQFDTQGMAGATKQLGTVGATQQLDAHGVTEELGTYGTTGEAWSARLHG